MLEDGTTRTVTLSVRDTAGHRRDRRRHLTQPRTCVATPDMFRVCDAASLSSGRYFNFCFYFRATRPVSGAVPTCAVAPGTTVPRTMTATKSRELGDR